MAATTQSSGPFTGYLVSKPSASDLLRSSRNGISGIPLRPIGRGQIGAKRRDLSISAKLRKGKKYDYPWPKDPDPNVKGGVLSHLSHFKPLKDKPKPVTLEFEKPLIDLQKKIMDVQRMANDTGLDFSDQIISLENKYHQALKELYRHLTPIQRVHIARHPHRPTCLDHVFNITETFVELHGDRAGYDDPAIVTGLGTINGRCYMFIGHQKGRNTKENIKRNFGMPTPHGYRKALRMMYYADHHGFPIVTFIDTPGAYADLKSEHLGQGEAIAHNLRTMFGLKVPVISIVIGEGGSGGALAIGCANKLLMLENAVFYVASPEACAAILYKSAAAAPKAAAKLRITAPELCRLKVADGVIPEPLGGAHADPDWTSQQIKSAIVNTMDELVKMDSTEIMNHRKLKFRKMGRFIEGIPVDPAKKVNMKKREVPIIQPAKISNVARKVNMKKKETPIIQPGKISNVALKDEVEKLKQQILEARESSGKMPESGLKEMISKLKREIDYEYSKAAKSLGFDKKILLVREEFAKAGNASDQPLNSASTEKIDKLKEEFNQILPTAPNYASLKFKLDMLQEISRAQSLSGKNGKAFELEQEITKRFKEVTERPDIKQKFEALKTEIENSGMSDSVKDKILSLNNEIDLEFSAVLKSLGLQVNPPEVPDAKAKIDDFNSETKAIMEDVISSSDLKNKIELLKIEVVKAGKTPDPETKAKIQALEQQIKQSLADAMNNFPGLQDRHERLKEEISEALESSSEGTNGSLPYDHAPEVESQVKIASGSG